MDEKKPRIDSFKQFLRQVSRARHFSWGAGDVQHLPKKDDRSGHFSWHAGDVQHLPKKIKDTLGEDSEWSHYDHINHLLHDPHPLTNTRLHDVDFANQGRHRETYEEGHHLSHSAYKAWSHNINDPLRGSGQGDFRNRPEELLQHVHNLEHITSVPLEHPTHVYRGFTNDFPIHLLQRGAEFHDKGFTGTSLFPEMATHYGGHHERGAPTPISNYHHRVIARIELPSGIRGHLMDHPDYNSNINKEGEFLLHRGTHFRVLGHAMSTQHEAQPFHGNYHEKGPYMRDNPILHVVHMKAIGQENE